MEAEPPKRKRRWFQFSLRFLLIFTAIVGVGCALLAHRIEHKCREQDAVEAISALVGFRRFRFDPMKDCMVVVKRKQLLASVPKESLQLIGLCRKHDEASVVGLEGDWIGF